MEVKIKTGIRLLIFFYIFIIVEHFSMRGTLKMDAFIEALFIGTLAYLVIGYLRRIPVARWIGIGFHGVFQAMETWSVFFFLRPEVFAQMSKDLPVETAGIAKYALAFVFALVTFINISAVFYLLKNRDYFLPGQEAGMEESA
jgi:hypothetical protein